MDFFAQLPHSPTAEQSEAIAVFERFAADRDPATVMILRGAAGTGKTTLAAAIVRTLAAARVRLVLLAPTGRAAKVFALSSGHPAFTIHRMIYSQAADGPRLAPNRRQRTLFIVDEASMIANRADGECLLDDLVHYIYDSDGCRLLLVGDAAQLPPVGEEGSPALSAEALEAYGLKVYEAELSQVLRQAASSGILYNATRIRAMLQSDEPVVVPQIRFQGFADIVSVPGDELIESLATSYSNVGADETMVITRSNKRAGIYNQGIRGMVLGREEELTPGDMIMIVKNNYHYKFADAFIANGDRAIVRRVRGECEAHGLRFADVAMTFPDYDDYELTATVALDCLHTDTPALTREQTDALAKSVEADYADMPTAAERDKMIAQDKYLHALQAKYAYAATCHKAQGGGWAHVYVDQGYITDDMLTPDYLHWLYTAFTRATEKLFLVNWKQDAYIQETPDS